MKRLLPVLMGWALLLLSSTEGWSVDFQKGLDAYNGTLGVSTFLVFQKPLELLAERGKGKRRRMRGMKNKMFRSEPCTKCEKLEGFVSPSEIDDDIRKMVGKYRGGGGPENVAIQQARGVIETGLYPGFIGGANCPEIDSEKWAIDYSYKRGAGGTTQRDRHPSAKRCAHKGSCWRSRRWSVHEQGKKRWDSSGLKAHA